MTPKCLKLWPLIHAPLYLVQIRDIASTMDLPTKARKDSQGICFLGKLKFDDFLRHYLGENPGDVVWDDNGLVVGALHLSLFPIYLLSFSHTPHSLRV